MVATGDGGPGLLGRESGSHHCQSTAFLDKTACVSYGAGQDDLGDGCVHGHPFPHVIAEGGERGWGGGCGGDNGLIQVGMGILPRMGNSSLLRKKGRWAWSYSFSFSGLEGHTSSSLEDMP